MRENTVIYQLTSIQASQSRSGSRRWGAVAGTRAAPARRRAWLQVMLLLGRVFCVCVCVVSTLAWCVPAPFPCSVLAALR